MSTTRSLNPASARLTGMGLDLVRDRTGRITAGYLDWLGGTGEIRLASWNPSATSHATVVAAMPMTGRPDSFALAMDVDSEGRLHFVAAVPTSDVTKELRYYWQVTPGLGSPWAFDVVDSDVYLAGSPALADMVVSPGGQPHIIYFDPSTGHVSYATILAP